MQNMLSMLPFNIGLLVLTAENTRGLRPVKVLDIVASMGEGTSKNFHPDGLFSIETFGKVGDERRNRLFGYIALNVEILHPVIFKAIVDLKELYGRIMAGSAYAVFNKQTHDFEPANITEGQTGFQFFMEHFADLKFEERNSTAREFAIKMVYKERDKAIMNRLIVMPAGLRDFTIQENGKPDEDEINGIYRRILSISNVIGTHRSADTEHLNATRHSLQLEVVKLYDYIVNLLEGKSKLIQGNWTNRNVFSSTRNVITSNVPRVKSLSDPLTTGPNHTVIGLYQSIRMIFPLFVNLLKNRLQDVFTGPNTPAYLIDKKTLKKETVSIGPEHYDTWMTQEGIESLLNQFEVEPLRHDVIEVDGRYLFLTYQSKDSVRLVQGIQDLPEGIDPKDCHPTTFAELYYLTVLTKIRSIPMFVTRYPVISFGGIYPSYIYLKTTTRSVCLNVLGEDWRETGEIANEFPVDGVSFVNSMSPAASHLGGLGADSSPVTIVAGS